MVATRTRLALELKRANAAFRRDYPGDLLERQPVHTVYGGAHLFKATTPRKLGELALRALNELADDGPALSDALGLGLSGKTAEQLYQRVAHKLKSEPVEDFRIDFEDGFGVRSDQEEDAEAVRAATELATAKQAGMLPPFVGVRIKSFSEESSARAFRTLELFIGRLASTLGGALPSNFVVTLPKVTIPAQVAVLADLLSSLEAEAKLPEGSVRIELMVETPQALFDAEGQANLPRLVQAAKGRCFAAHFGAYDYTASCNVVASAQSLAHPACDFAREVMQVSLAGRGVFLSDGATNVLPVPIYRGSPAELSQEQRVANRAAMLAASRLHADNVTRALRSGLYQGWDLHPAQLPARYAAVYAFFLKSLEPMVERLVNFLSVASRATLVGHTFDDAATGQGLLNFFLRGIHCGALDAVEMTERLGLELSDLKTRSFASILRKRGATDG